ncbi:MAG: tyrosine--tRNA ligase [Parcubacteria group bacterium CG1_02_37_13]|nr:MAG: tyrosine--tRNA ligase [Parcubacteria group bacterium CG1_02_37_13]
MAKVITDKNKIREVLNRGVEEVVIKEHLEKALLSGKRLRVKFGIDPTSPDLHLGHSIPLKKLRQFQELGHNIILLIGDFTAQVGDPSGRMTSRKPLSAVQIKENMKEYTKQAGRIIDIKKAEIRYNSEWYKNKTMDFVMDITSRFTVARILERDDFQKRLKKDVDISMQEIYYPLMQGYDSVALNANVEIGGNDQKFNLLMGRKVQKKYNLPEQDIITTPLLIGTDGETKMSKSVGNYIKFNDLAKEMYGKTMSIPDQLIWHYFELLTEIPLSEIKQMQNRARASLLNYKEVKEKLAKELVKMYHGEKQAQKAKEEFNDVFQKGGLPSQISAFTTTKSEINILDLLFETGIAQSKSEAKRLVESKSIKINQAIKQNWREVLHLKDGDVVQAGKRKFIKIKMSKGEQNDKNTDN